MDVALVSCQRLPEPDPDAAPLAAALTAAGIEARELAWDDSAADWGRARLTVLRSCWDYPLRAPAFLAWIERAAASSELWNPHATVRWNLHKGYLLELAQSAIPVVPTVLVRRAQGEELDDVLARSGWHDVVVKPAVSAASRSTLRVRSDNRAEGAAHFRGLVAERDVLVQPYLESVEDYGERALVWIDGELTHAVRKSRRFAGEDEAVSEAVAIAPAEADVARRALAVAPGGPLLYARIDMAPGPDGTPFVMELELIEPSLFFRQGPRGLERFVEGIRRRLARARDVGSTPTIP